MFKLLLIFIGFTHAYAQEVGNIYKSCALKENGLLYNSKRNELCGVEKMDYYPHVACGVKSHIPCRHRSNSIESYERSSPHSHVAKILAIGDTCEDVAFRFLSQAPTPEIKHVFMLSDVAAYEADLNNSDLKTLFDKVSTPSLPYSGRPTKFSMRPAPNREGWRLEEYRHAYHGRLNSSNCQFVFYKVRPVYAIAPSQHCPVKEYNTCEGPVYKECRHESFGLQDYIAKPNPKCGVVPKAVSALSDNQYFYEIQSFIKNFAVDTNNENSWFGLGVLIDENNISKRKISLQFLSSLKSYIMSLDIRNASSEVQKTLKKYKALLLVDFYIRASNVYVNQRAKDLLKVDQLSILLKRKNLEGVRAKELMKLEVERLNVSDRLKEALLSRINGVSEADKELLSSILLEMSKIIRNDITLISQNTQEMVSGLSTIDNIFGFNQIHLYMNSGNYAQSLLKLQEAKIYFRLLQNTNCSNQSGAGCENKDIYIPTGEWLFKVLKYNAKNRVKKDLANANQVYEKISSIESDSVVDMDLSDNSVEVNDKIIQLLQELNTNNGGLLESTKYQLLDLIEKMIIEPLSSLNKDLENL